MIMVSLALIGLIGGLITGISPCILPVLPVVFFSGTSGVADGAVAVETKRDVSRPYRVIAGLVMSFSLVTLLGSDESAWPRPLSDDPVLMAQLSHEGS